MGISGVWKHLGIGSADTKVQVEGISNVLMAVVRVTIQFGPSCRN